MQTTVTKAINLTFLTFNIDMAVREEKVTKTKFINRSNKIKELIESIGADIVNLQELRQLQNTPTPDEFLTTFKNYKYVLQRRNPSDLAFGNAILYNSKKVFPVETMTKWLSDTPNEPSDTWSKDGVGRGAICFGVKFYHVVDEKVVKNMKPFWVFNTHFLLEEDIKTNSAKVLVDIISDCAGKLPWILSGDFNFFWDRDGDKQRKILIDSGMIDVGKDALTCGGKKVEGTFIGYDIDDFKSPLLGEENALLSRLDHIFIPECCISFSNPILYTRSHFFDTIEEDIKRELTHRDYPSDHLPILVDFKFEFDQ